MVISEKDLETIASMHISACIKDSGLKKPGSQYRFFLDKVKLFHDFDYDSIILKKNEKNEIAGILIYTYNEKDFNKFTGPGSMRFYTRALKTLFGFYGCRFIKFFSAARSMLGRNTDPDVSTADRFGKIWVLLVMEESRRQGIAVELLKKCIDEMKKRGETLLRVTVKTDNDPAIKAYEKSNFKIIGKCIESSGPSYVMQLEIKDDD